MYIWKCVYAPEINSTSLFYLAQAQLDEQLAGLQTLTAARRSKLEESIKLHQYLQDVEEVLSWLSDKESIASSNDYGKDFEHLQVYVQHCKSIVCSIDHSKSLQLSQLKVEVPGIVETLTFLYPGNFFFSVLHDSLLYTLQYFLVQKFA